MAKKGHDLTNGSILNKLLLIAGPIIATQLFQMAYNLIDMFFVGRISSDAVAATGSAGMFVWLSVAFFVIGSMGASIGVSQNKGKGDMVAAKLFAQNSLLISLILGTFYATVIIAFAPIFIDWLGIREYQVAQDAVLYLRLVAIAFPMLFANNAITGTFNGSGNSRLPFQLKMVGLAVNIIITPILIFVFDLGVMGAGISTAIGYATTGLLLIFAIKNPKISPFEDFKFKDIFKPDKPTMKQIFKWSLPVAIENGSNTLLTMVVMNMIASFGVNAVVTKQIGVNMESLTFLVGGGYAAAFTAFIGQNFGANQIDRIKKGFKISLVFQIGWGALVTLILIFSGGHFYRLFTDNQAIIESGIRYLRITAFIQITSAIEAISAGAFRGFGKTIPPSITIIVCNVLRIFIAYALSLTPLGLYGVFIGAASGIFMRGVMMLTWFLIYFVRNFKNVENVEVAV